jgi:hypothetical protein
VLGLDRPLSTNLIVPSKAFQVIVNKNLTRCNSRKSDLFYCNVILHVSGAHSTHHQEYRKLYPIRPTLEGSSCTDIMTCTGGCGYSF